MIDQNTVPSRPGTSISTAWMVTFSDLVVLMLAFFVLMFAMSAFKEEAFERLTTSLSETFRPRAVIVQPDQPDRSVETEGVTRPRGQDLGYLASVLETTFAEDPRLSGTLVQRLDDRVVLLLPADLLFRAGASDLSPGARPVVADLGAFLVNLRNRVVVAGHTDPNPPGAGSPFSDTWTLSVARAAAVANGLRQAGYAAPLEVWGHAGTRYDALASVAERERERLARRVDIVILPERVGGLAG